ILATDSVERVEARQWRGALQGASAAIEQSEGDLS
ncbi:MAG: hypothetical protein JWM19_3264, partial [Actinomycetia bacterium]|nr:hypothetical protein [Actinomycetes bacterium]